VLSETPEIHGVEHLLTRRAARPEVARRLMEKVAWWQEYARGESNQFNNNPPPGNTEGGLATIYEKSLGAIAKAGTTNLNAVYDYAERITERGLVFMDAPGFDPVAATGQVAGGCNVICFTTGRGSVFGCRPVPSLKLASNTPMFRRMQDDMDINCGTIIDGADSIEAKGREIFETILRVASGARTRSEELGLGSAEFVPWRLGAVS
jgi:altronate hydrolase